LFSSKRLDNLGVPSFSFSKVGNSSKIFPKSAALLCYTEFAGGLKRDKFQQGEAARNFKMFMAFLGVD